MNRRMCVFSVLTAALLLSSTGARAQRRGPGGPPPFGEPMELMGFEGVHGGQVVKGAPFSATVASETTSTLQDGTVIHRTSQGVAYRDSLGRSRREMTVSGFGPLAASGGTHTMVSIADPVLGAHFMLDTANKIAHKMTLHQPGADSSTASGQTFQQKLEARRQQEEAAGTLKTESLGTQTINGLSVQGTRTTHTIPAGQIGNDKAIQVVSERWFSPDLQIVVKSTRTDPQFGTTTYTVTNIQRTEPAAALFAVPSDFTVRTGGPGGHKRGLGPGGPAPLEAPDQD